MTRLLIVDDEIAIGNFLSHLFTTKGYQVTVASSGKEFFEIDFSKQIFQAAMIDLKLPNSDGLSLLRVLKEKQPSCKAIIMTGYSTIHTAVEAMKLGAIDYIEKPFDDIDILEKQIESLLSTPEGITEHHITELAHQVGLIIGQTNDMNHLIQTAYKVAGKNINVLIEGETGTGKEVLARFIHESSKRSKESFIGVNCGAISKSLLESELFGHEKGAFTGATQQRKGLFEIANNGTLFLDEIAEASLSIQVKLLRVLETREFMRVGSERVFHTNARIVAASNENLLDAVHNKKFREDLFYRLNVVHLKIPPLRERKQDLPQLLLHLVKRASSIPITFSDAAIEILQNYDWPGNIRELSNYVTRVVTLSDSTNGVITAKDLPAPNNVSCSSKTIKLTDSNQIYSDHSLEEYLNRWVDSILRPFEQNKDINLEEVLTQIKGLEAVVGKAFIQKALKDTLGNRKEAAKRLQITMRKLRYLLNEKKESEKVSGVG